MYVPEHFRETDSAAAYAFMMAHPFGLAVTVVDGAPFISHVPFLVDAAAGRIRWHPAAANPQSAQLGAADQATLVFLGPHAYVSPR